MILPLDAKEKNGMQRWRGQYIEPEDHLAHQVVREDMKIIPFPRFDDPLSSEEKSDA